MELLQRGSSEKEQAHLYRARTRLNGESESEYQTILTVDRCMLKDRNDIPDEEPRETIRVDYSSTFWPNRFCLTGFFN